MDIPIQPRFPLAVFAVAGAVALTGCVREAKSGDVTTFSNEPWVPIVIFVVGMGAGVAGFFLRNAIRRVGWGMLILGPILAILLSLTALFDRATVDGERFTCRTGFIGINTTQEVRWADLATIRLTKEKSSGRRGRKNISYCMNCESRDGRSEKISLGNSVAKAASRQVLQTAKERNIPILDETGG